MIRVIYPEILGGYNIKIEEAPYQINYGDICGGVLINDLWAITTAHCGTDSKYIRIGSKYRLRGPKVKILVHIVHPLFGKLHEFDYDLQLLRFHRRLRFNKLVQPIGISDGECGNSIYVSGWGYPKEKGEYQDILQQVELKSVPMDICQKVNQSWYNNTLTNRMFCAGGGSHDACQDSVNRIMDNRFALELSLCCSSDHVRESAGFHTPPLSKGLKTFKHCFLFLMYQGDSGGAAVAYGRLVGLSTFGYGCGRNIPGVYLNVSEPTIREWIRTIAEV
ncbi:trypsin-7-like [Hyposmocoma kahamanoa]|uniref:trypsin-7-like n=1 Tax=Hyposmocoma kahamanoa TaxID=1477025 RepID=UPI000E6D5D26|nr:trypsin-7-like [Hyposmocoma kahamanoa]